MPITASITLYCIAWGVLMRSVTHRLPHPPKLLPWILTGALVVHGISIYHQMVVPEGYHLGFFQVLSVFFWTTNLLLLASSLRKPLHNLFLITLPVAVLALLSGLYAGTEVVTSVTELTWGVASHILLSILAYSVMIIATVQALILAYQNYKLRHKHPGGIVRLLPPLQTMETLLFELLWIGEVLLTLVIITGATQIYSLAAQHLYHKIVFTIIAWLIYAVLLWGRHALGWRGNSAIRWTLSGFGFLVLAYLGSKLVLELILGVETQG